MPARDKGSSALAPLVVVDFVLDGIVVTFVRAATCARVEAYLAEAYLAEAYLVEAYPAG